MTDRVNERDSLEFRFAERELPGDREFLKSLLGNLEEAETASEPDLLVQIATIEREPRQISIARMEAFKEIRWQLMAIWYTLKWMKEQKLRQIECEILVFSALNLFYAYWCLWGKLLNQVYDLGFDFDEHAPSCHKVLRCCKEKKIIGTLYRLIEASFNSVVQREIISHRHSYTHRHLIQFGEIERIKDISREGDQIRIDGVTTKKPDLSQMFYLLKDGFFELLDTIPQLQRDIDLEQQEK